MNDTSCLKNLTFNISKNDFLVRNMTDIIRNGDTLIAGRGSFFDKNVRTGMNLIIPPETHIWGNLDVGGRVEIGSRSSIGGGVKAASAVIGEGAMIEGPLQVDGDLFVCDNARIHSINAKGNITLRPGIKVGEVRSDNTIYVLGKVKSQRLIGRTVKVSRD